MIIMKPVDTFQTIFFIPRKFGSTQATIYIKKEGEAIDFTQLVSVYTSQNYRAVVFACDILEEGATYSLQLTAGSTLLFRGKIFATNQIDKALKHNYSDSTYKEYNEVDDDSYII